MIKFNSLKAKIISLLTITCLTIAFMLFYIFINFYKKDKIAHIFESNAARLETAGEQFRREVEFTAEIVKVHLENVKKNKKLSLSSESTLPEAYYLDFIAIYLKNSNKPVDRLSKANAEVLSDTEITRIISAQKSNASQAVFIHDLNVTVVLNFAKNEQEWALIYQFKSSTLSDYFRNSEALNTALVDKTIGVQKFEYPPSDDLNTTVVNQELSQQATKILLQDSVTQMISLAGHNYLLSSVKLYQSNVFLSSFLSEEKVLENLKALVIRSFFFFIFISSVVILISYLSSHYLTHRLNKLTESAKRIAGGQFDEKIKVTGTDEISTLTNGFNQMSIEIVRLLHETANKVRMESELKTAQLVQSTLLPQNEYESSFIQIKGCYTSASECGGDWWHYFESEDKVWVWIADATGHGAGAAMLTSAAKSAVSIIEKLNLPIQESFELLNLAICNVSKQNMMMTSLVGVVNKKTLEFSYINASHEPSILIRKSESITKDDLIFLNESTNPRLGQGRDSKYTSNTLKLNPGDRIFFYTDGVTDIRSPDGKTYGERTLIKSIVKSYNSTKNIDDFYADYETSLNTFRSNTELVDDVTYCFFEVK